MSADAVSQAAARLRAASETRQPCAPVIDLITPGDVAAAYAVQDINTELGLKAGRRLVGRKIGLTSRAVQTQLGVDQPDFGMLFADMDIADGETVAMSRLLQPKVEAEIAFVLGRDLPNTDITTAELISAVDYAVAAIEIVDSRIANWKISIADTIADNASSGLFVLGTQPRPLSALDLPACTMSMTANDAEVSKGAGAACLGHPLYATRWLAIKLAEMGRPLKAGDVVLSGALGPMVAVEPGQAYVARISDLGTVRVQFEA